MQPSRRVIWGAGAVFCVAGALYAFDEPAAPASIHNDQQSGLMLAKLASTQKITEGLVSKDFDQIRRGARELQRICDATEWAARSDPVYAHHRTELRRQARKLEKLAGEGNLDGAAFTYMHSLTTCINCHEYCRDVLRIADEELPVHKLVPIPTDPEALDPAGRPVRE